MVNDLAEVASEPLLENNSVVYVQKRFGILFVGGSGEGDDVAELVGGESRRRVLFAADLHLCSRTREHEDIVCLESARSVDAAQFMCTGEDHHR